MQREKKPGRNELHKKLTAAKEAIHAGRRSIADGDNNRHVVADMEELRLSNLEEYWQLVYECVQLALEDPLGCYRHPTPRKSTKMKETKGLFMWPFEVHHEECDQNLYFKFCLKEDTDGKYYLHIDCHESRKDTF